jgi:two-component system phosphate regulon sensor histidine kinase PhoR
MYVAIPVKEDQKLTGFIRVSLPLLFIDKVLKAIYLKLMAEGLIAAIIAVFISFFIAGRISKPLEDLGTGAKQFAKGDLKYRLSIPKTKEIGELALAMNEMAAQLDSKITLITQQSNELEVILSSLEEGVIAIDINERIIKLNQAAAKLIGVNSADVQNQKIQEVIRNSDLHKFIAKALSTKYHVQEEIIFYNYGKESIIQVYSTALQNTEGENIGALIVLNDITKLKKLENVRRDFIANVSHELRTPITSIKGYAETLIDGALDDREKSEKFINIVLNQANRLNSIIEDLLSLSKLDRESDESELVTEECKIIDIIKSAIQLCSLKAESGNVETEVSCSEDLKMQVNPSLIEQVIVNLLDNAVKYTPEGGKVLIEALSKNNEVIIKVIDHGCGIPKEHLPRIFERFYRVDKARSRKLGGTGLGLAIVKHICQAHGGYAKVESTIGTGSTFSIHLPFTP